INEDLAEWLAANDYFYIMHRLQPETRLDFVRNMQTKELFASISVGIKQAEYTFIDELKANDLTPEYITIDVAHGHSDSVIIMTHHIKEDLPAAFGVAGNRAPPEAGRAVELPGADASKMGVGPGGACIAKRTTGLGTGGRQRHAPSQCP